MTTCRIRFNAGRKCFYVDGDQVEERAFSKALAIECRENAAARELQNGKRFRQPALQRGIDYGWQNENGGLGRAIHQLESYPGDPEACCRSRSEIPEKAKRKGFLTIEKC